MGKGSKPRPLSVSQTDFDKQWDLIFGGKNMKHEHQRGIITEELSRFYSDNGKIEAAVVRVDKSGYAVEVYEKSRYIRTIDVSVDSENVAENIAEDIVSGADFGKFTL